MNDVQTEKCIAFMGMERAAQMNALQKDGVYVGKQKAGDGTALLYQYHTIYVEVVYSVHRSHVEAVNCFTDTAVLDRYIS